MRRLCAIAFAAVVGCSALSGAGDFTVETPCVSCDADAAEASPPDDAPAPCPPRFFDCNGLANDGCEVDTSADKENCGGCGILCTVANTTCTGGTCGPFPSCKAILAADPTAPSGTFTIDPDGSGPDAPLEVTCDMTTAGGGFTLVFIPTTFNYELATIDYTVRSFTLLNDAKAALLAFRNSENGDVVGTTAVFDLPPEWKAAAPFRAKGQDRLTDMRLDGVSTSKVLRFGYSSFDGHCEDAWDQGATYGRLCIVSSTAPFFSGFAAVGAVDSCTTSLEVVGSALCTKKRQFTIGVR